MPGPFPGMDPYLENPAFWPNLHLLLISAANAILKPVLRPRGYLVALGERVSVTQPRRSAYPDVAVITRPQNQTTSSATAVEIDEPLKIKLIGEEIREPYMEIIDASGGNLVTGIEFLSPYNKATGPGRNLYLRKQRETLAAGANLIEVDLLRKGRHTVAVPEHSLSDSPAWDYLVSIARAAQPDEFEVYPIPMRSRLPRIPIPLKPGDQDAALDLQAVMNRAYEEGQFEDRIDYSQPLFGRTSRENLAWADALLRERELRGQAT